LTSCLRSSRAGDGGRQEGAPFHAEYGSTGGAADLGR
jgi:hypothetical protein